MTVYIEGKSKTVTYIGLEHLEPFQPAFHWQITKVEVPTTEDLHKARKRELSKERNRARSLIKYHQNNKNISVEEATALVLKKSKYSNIGYSTNNLKTQKILKAGI